ncbi:uncharacterized protein F5Z01DRAFT_217470 [Emericellopsis atlantica]|uniref:Uncharacterized protein n=1 Tax=Emericellopsis atlantica TaxID=2614577 RepID=A0A9P7ZJ55_9HYPO|nr:uncharacterized protein F5Z01DRAFT_217470 [Emericellopsis atlantica]KAG9252575.1 hypothetical protein F5Z01DRAFT_217470 [Emericellopsis atlantica]
MLEDSSLQTLMATTKYTIRSGSRRGKRPSTEDCCSSSESDREKTCSLYILAHTERLALSSHRCAQARSACGHTFMPPTRPTTTSAHVGTDCRRCDISCSNAETGRTNDNRCGQANLHALTSNGFSAARQWQSKQQK